MDVGFGAVDVSGRQTADTLWIQTGNGDSTGVSTQPKNPELGQDTWSYLTEPSSDASSAAYDGYNDADISQSVPMPGL